MHSLAVRPASTAAIAEQSTTATRPRSPVSAPIPALDGLRGLAILLVLVWHTSFQLQPHSESPAAHLLRFTNIAWTGVDLFFVLSGFLIAGILFDARESPNYFRTFYLRRAYRILPLYWVVLIISFAAAGFGSTLGSSWTWLSAQPLPFWSYATLTQNMLMAVHGTFGLAMLTVTWSLAVEEQFYVSIPWLVRYLHPRCLLCLLAAVCISAPALRHLVHLWSPHPDLASYVLLPTRAEPLALGVAAALLVRHERAWTFLLQHRTWLQIAFATLLAGTLAYAYTYGAGIYLARPGASRFPSFGYSVVAIMYATGLLLAVSGNPRWLSMAALQRLGLLAYAIYLLHLPLIGAMETLALRLPWQSAIAQLAYRLIAVAMCIALAQLSWTFLERPFIARGHRHRY